MEPFWIGIAFVLGWTVRQVGLPPLVGYLVAGFVLHGIGAEAGPAVAVVSDVGVTLLLFTIGLKLHVRSLIRPEVWAGATIHMAITAVVFGTAMLGLGAAGLSRFAGLDLGTAALVAFALSFSSTVFAVKVFEDRGEMASRHARVAIGILIVEDIAAVVFLAFSAGKVPTAWALLLLGLPFARPVLAAIMDRCGHGELLIVFGLLLALAGAQAFELVGVKGDLGAIILGVMLARSPKSSELARELMGFKDLFLIGFFLSIGLKGAPTLEAIGIGGLLAAACVFKVALFFVLLTRFRLRARTALLATASLATYSEFGLIVAAVGDAAGWIEPEWLVIIAIALSITFVAASPINALVNVIYARHRERLSRFETATRLPDDAAIDPGDAEVVIFGMGRVGTSAYDLVRERLGDVVLGVDFDPDTVAAHAAAGRRVILGDPTDLEFWERQTEGERRLRLAIMTMPRQAENEVAIREVKASGFAGTIAATARYDDEVEALRAAGADEVGNFYAEAGAGFAAHVLDRHHPDGGAKP
ncbi:MAG: cation:proton antiporter domain-containing protein [Planctomycetota bacterium]|jgi:predicted Kef-type K+ transport protein